MNESQPSFTSEPHLIPQGKRGERDQNDTNRNPYLPCSTEPSRADTFLLPVVFVGLIWSAS
jgi:hypothetical protein